MSVPEYRRGGSQLACYDMAQTLQVSILRDLPAALESAKTDSPAMLGRLVAALQSDVHALVCDILHADAIKPQFLWEVDERRRNIKKFDADGVIKATDAAYAKYILGGSR